MGEVAREPTGGWPGEILSVGAAVGRKRISTPNDRQSFCHEGFHAASQCETVYLTLQTLPSRKTASKA